MLLEINHLEKVFRTRFSKEVTRALQDVDFKVDEKEFIAIMGESGSGKTTLLNILATLEKPTNGSVFLNGQEITKIKESNLADFRLKNLGFVFQDFNLLDTLSVKDNIFLPLVLGRVNYQEMEKRIAVLAPKLHIEELLEKRPFELSGGQKQRVAIARGLAMQPELLLFDEPTSALDPETIGDVLAVMQNLAKEGMNMVVVTHEMGFAREVADRIIFMAEGQILVDTTDVQGFFDNPTEPRAKQFLSKVINHTSDNVSQN